MNEHDKPKYNIVRDDFSTQSLCDAALEMGLYDFDDASKSKAMRIGDGEEEEEDLLGILEVGDLFEEDEGEETDWDEVIP